MERSRARAIVPRQWTPDRAGGGRIDVLVNDAAFQRGHEDIADFSAEEIGRTYA
jgi:NAD(P)-dependent dehydrogenase (short-subunit alcohol dehydrogenase family)